MLQPRVAGGEDHAEQPVGGDVYRCVVGVGEGCAQFGGDMRRKCGDERNLRQFGVARPDRLDEESVEPGLGDHELREPVDAGRQVVHVVDQFGHEVGGDRVGEPRLVAEGLVDQRLGDPGCGGDVADRGGRAVGTDGGSRRLDDATPLVVAISGGLARAAAPAASGHRREPTISPAGPKSRSTHRSSSSGSS